MTREADLDKQAIAVDEGVDFGGEPTALLAHMFEVCFSSDGGPLLVTRTTAMSINLHGHILGSG